MESWTNDYPHDILAIDCEMVGVGRNGKQSILARVSIVDYYGNVLLDEYVKPTEEVTDYRTEITGITPEKIENGECFEDVRAKVLQVIKNCVLVGHAIQNDLEVLKLDHPKHKIRDTQQFPEFQECLQRKNPSLKDLVRIYLRKEIHAGEHDSVQDAKLTLLLYRIAINDMELFADNIGDHNDNIDDFLYKIFNKLNSYDDDDADLSWEDPGWESTWWLCDSD